MTSFRPREHCETETGKQVEMASLEPCSFEPEASVNPKMKKWKAMKTTREFKVHFGVSVSVVKLLSSRRACIGRYDLYSKRRSLLSLFVCSVLCRFKN